MAAPIRAWLAFRSIARLVVTFIMSRRPRLTVHAGRSPQPSLHRRTPHCPSHPPCCSQPGILWPEPVPQPQVDSCARVRRFPPSRLSTAASTCTPPGATAATLTAAPAGAAPPPTPRAFFTPRCFASPASPFLSLPKAHGRFLNLKERSDTAVQLGPRRRESPPHVLPPPKNSAAFALGTLRPTRVDRITYRYETGNPLASPAPP
jgi:hypothetical protein